MKIILAIMSVMVFSIALFMQCSSQKQPKVTYSFPAIMTKPVRDHYTAICEKGRVLYEINCAGCHNKKVNGKTVIPDFSEAQMLGYALRVLNAEHEKALPEENITPEELGFINTFLMYKTRNTTTAKK